MRFFYFIVMAGLISCTEPKPDTSTKKKSFRNFTENGAWCWFSDPRAVHYSGKFRRTYAGWVDSSGNIMVGYYDHGTKKIKEKIIHKNLEIDDHDNPSLFIDNNGKLFVFYSKHAGPEPIYLAKAKNSEDMEEWETTEKLYLNDTLNYQGLSNSYTYTNICQLTKEKNKMYLFWRGMDFKPNFSVSHDNGESWENGKIFILPDRTYKDRRPYLKMASNHKDVIHFVFTDGHPRNEKSNSIYYLKYQNGILCKASNEKIIDWSELPIRPEQSDLVYDANISGQKACIWDIAENKQGNPVIVYSKFPNDSNHIYNYAVWDNMKWNNYELINSGGWFPETPKGKIQSEPNYSGGITLDHTDPSIIYLSIMKNGKFEIEKWTTNNQGKDWSKESITKNSELNNVRPYVIQNYPTQDSLRVLWMSVKKYNHYTDYISSIKMNIIK
jgi:hypothetical protein